MLDATTVNSFSTKAYNEWQEKNPMPEFVRGHDFLKHLKALQEWYYNQRQYVENRARELCIQEELSRKIDDKNKCKKRWIFSRNKNNKNKG